MIDIKLIREEPDLFREAMEKRGETSSLGDILQADGQYLKLLRRLEELRARHNETSRQLGRTKERPPELIAEMRQLGEEVSSLQQETREAKANLDTLLLGLPNIPHPSVPLGEDSSDNIIVRTWGEPKSFSFKPLPHWELGENLGIIDFAAGAKLSGSRFYVLKGLGARLQRALISFMLDLHVK